MGVDICFFGMVVFIWFLVLLVRYVINVDILELVEYLYSSFYVCGLIWCVCVCDWLVGFII